MNNEIRNAYQASGLTMAEISRCLQVPERTLQDWIYGKRQPRRADIPERIKILSVLSPEERAEINWPEAIRLYKIRTAAGNADGSFEKFIGLVPETVLDQVNTEGLKDAVNALHRAYEEGRKSMWNTIILKKGTALLSNSEYSSFQKFDTIEGIDANPTEIRRWNIDQEAEARQELEKYECTYSSNGSVWSIEEYELEYCRTDEDGEFLEGSDYEPARIQKWYAVMKDREDDDWGYGSHSLEEAKQMCRESGADAYIAVIDDTLPDAVCVGEIEQAEF